MIIREAETDTDDDADRPSSPDGYMTISGRRLRRKGVIDEAEMLVDRVLFGDIVPERCEITYLDLVKAEVCGSKRKNKLKFMRDVLRAMLWRVGLALPVCFIVLRYYIKLMLIQTILDSKVLVKLFQMKCHRRQWLQWTQMIYSASSELLKRSLGISKQRLKQILLCFLTKLAKGYKRKTVFETGFKQSASNIQVNAIIFY